MKNYINSKIIKGELGILMENLSILNNRVNKTVQ